MAEKRTVARPYAQGVFALAKADDNLAAWSGMLAALGEVARHDKVRPLLDNPLVERQVVVDLLIEACGDSLDQKGRNLVRLLSENRRLGLIPQIAEQYEALRREAEGRVDAELLTARSVPEDALQKLEQALGKRLGLKVTLTPVADHSLIGGAVLRAGDLVIDGSIKGQLQRLADALSR